MNGYVRILIAAMIITSINTGAAAKNDVGFAFDEIWLIDARSNEISDDSQISMVKSYKFFIDNWRDESHESIRELTLESQITGNNNLISNVETWGKGEMISRNPYIVIGRNVSENHGGESDISISYSLQKEVKKPPFYISRSFDRVYFESEGVQIITVKLIPKSYFENIYIEISTGLGPVSEAEASIVGTSLDYISNSRESYANFDIRNPVPDKEYIVYAKIRVTPKNGAVSFVPHVWAEFREIDREEKVVFGKNASWTTDFGAATAESVDNLNYHVQNRKYYWIVFDQISTSSEILPSLAEVFSKLISNKPSSALTPTPTPISTTFVIMPTTSPSTLPEATSLSNDFLARVFAMFGLIILTIIFSKENNRTKLFSYAIAGMAAYAILDLVSGLLKNDIFVLIGGVGAAVFGILSRDKKRTVLLTVGGTVSFIVGFAIFTIIVGGNPEVAGPKSLFAFFIWGGIHGIGVGTIYKNLKKIIMVSGTGAFGFLIALAFFGIYSKAVIGVGEPGNPFGYGIFGGVLGGVIGIGMYYISPQKTGIQAEPEIKPQRTSEPISLEPSPTPPKTFPPELLPKYTDVEFLGKGGFARVFKVKRRDGRIVALKTPLNPDEETGKSFLREMNVTSWRQLNHRNIVAVFDVNVLPIPYLEIEYMEGGNLENLQKPLEIELACEIVFDIAEGLKYAHEMGIIHRDLKPQNILFTKDKIPKITDWGTGRIIDEGKSTTQRDYTPAYAAPEQVSPNKFGKTDERTDIYQLGVIFYNLLTNDLPFKGKDIYEIASAIVMKKPPTPSKLNTKAKKVEHIILKCLSKKKEDRYQSTEELQQEVEKSIKKPREKQEDIQEKLQQETVRREKMK